MTAQTLVSNLEVPSSLNASLSDAKYTPKPFDTHGTKRRLPSAAQSSSHPQTRPQEKTESKSKRAAMNHVLSPWERKAIEKMGEYAKEAQLQYAKCLHEHNKGTEAKRDTAFTQLIEYSGECLESLNSLLHALSCFRFRHTANQRDHNEEITVGKVVFLYDESIRRLSKGKEVDISYEVCDEESKLSEEKRTEPQGKVVKAFLEGDPMPFAEEGSFKNEKSVAYLLHVLFFLTHYMIDDLIVVVNEDTEYRDANDGLCSKQNNSNSWIPIKKEKIYVEIPKREELIGNDEDKERMSIPACKEQFPHVLSQLIKFVTEIVRTILGNMASDSMDKELVDNLFGKERVHSEKKYLWVDNKRIEWENYMRAIRVSQGDFS